MVLWNAVDKHAQAHNTHTALDAVSSVVCDAFAILDIAAKRHGIPHQVRYGSSSAQPAYLTALAAVPIVVGRASDAFAILDVSAERHGIPHRVRYVGVVVHNPAYLTALTAVPIAVGRASDAFAILDIAAERRWIPHQVRYGSSSAQPAYFTALAVVPIAVGRATYRLDNHWYFLLLIWLTQNGLKADNEHGKSLREETLDDH